MGTVYSKNQKKGVKEAQEGFEKYSKNPEWLDALMGKSAESVEEPKKDKKFNKLREKMGR